MENTPNAKPFYKKKWFIFVSIFAVLAIIGSFTGEDQTVQEEQFIAVTDITANTGFDEDANEYFWGANFKADLPANTKLNCKITALDSNGAELASYEYMHNVVNNGVVVGYGENAVAQVADEATVNAISSFDVKCKKA